MLFNSYIFILFFFPVTMFIYYICNHFHKYALGQYFLIGMSLYFYAYFNISYLPVILISIVGNYLCSRLLLKTHGKTILVMGLMANIGAIFYFKYFDFFISNVNHLFQTDFALHHILMPLGISFFTFQQISYLVDSYRGETREYGFREYALFVCFFPQLIAGPIVSHEEMIPQFQSQEKKGFDHSNFSKGLYFFSVGLGKKVLLADTLALGVNWAYGNISSLTSLTALTAVVFYCFQLYFDFSGYCDMANGIALCFNIHLPINFNSPYQSASVPEVWKRWHITLGRFLRKYVYIPLGGSRKGTARTLINLMIVFLVSGIWHGANWTFVFWGLLQGIGCCVYRLISKVWDKLLRPLRVFLTFSYFCFSFLFFRADSMADAWQMCRRLVSGLPLKWNTDFLNQYNILEFDYPEGHISILGRLITRIPSLHIWILGGIAVVILFFKKNVYEKKFCPEPKTMSVSVLLLIWSILSLTNVSTFLYFNF